MNTIFSLITQWAQESIPFVNVDYWCIFHYDIYVQYVDMPEMVKDLRFLPSTEANELFSLMLVEDRDTWIRVFSIHVHVVFCCPQRPQNNVDRFRQLFHTKGLWLCLGAEFRGKSHSLELWYATKPFQTLLPCLLLTHKSTCSIIGRHYPYYFRPSAIQVSLTRWFRKTVLSELPEITKTQELSGNCPTAGCGCEKKWDLITSVVPPWAGWDRNSEKSCICFMFIK